MYPVLATPKYWEGLLSALMRVEECRARMTSSSDFSDANSAYLDYPIRKVAV